jgi:hypothetical protein
MDLGAAAAGLGAVATGAGGVVILVHEFRRKDRLALNQSVDEMNGEIAHLRDALLACRRYAFNVALLLADRGQDVPPRPELHVGDDEPPAG